MITNVGITIIVHPPVITIDSWHVHHSQSRVVYDIVIPTLYAIGCMLGVYPQGSPPAFLPGLTTPCQAALVMMKVPRFPAAELIHTAQR